MAVASPAPPASKAPAGTAPPSGGEIHIGAPPVSVNEGNPTLPPTDPKSAKGQMFSALRKKAGVVEPAAPAKPKGIAPAEPPADPARPGATADDPNTDPAADPAAPTDPAAAPAVAPAADPASPESKKKVGPWQLADMYKARAVQAEARALELEKSVVPESKRKETQDRLTQYEARIKEMQDDLRYHNAEKYDPDIIKANSDYEGAWKTALSELSEIPVTDPATGQARGLNANDLLELVNMPLGKAREIADSDFGPFADDVMAHRKEIKKLFEAKSSKLEELKKNGGEREKQRREQWEKVNGEMSSQIKTLWEQENAAVLANEKHGKFFKPREGDADWNTRIERGFKFVDDALSLNPADPRLTPDQRALAIRKHVAVRNRAAGFEAMRLDYERVSAKLAKAQKDLDGYQKSTPGAGGTVAPNGTPVTGSAKEQMFSALRKLAK